MVRKAKLMSAERPLHKQPLWLFGFVFYAMAAPLDIVAYACAPQTLCAVLGTAKLVFAALFGSLLVQEVLRPQDLGGTLMCVLGTSLTFLARPHASANAHQMTSLGEIFTPEVSLFLVTMAPTIATVSYFEYTGRFDRLPKAYMRFLLPSLSAATYGVAKLLNSILGWVKRGTLHWALVFILMNCAGLANLTFNMRGAFRQCISEFIPINFVLCTGVQFFTALVVLGETWAGKTSFALVGAAMAVVGAVLVRPQQEEEQQDAEKLTLIRKPSTPVDQVVELVPVVAVTRDGADLNDAGLENFADAAAEPAKQQAACTEAPAVATSGGAELNAPVDAISGALMKGAGTEAPVVVTGEPARRRPSR
jgi:hypothetical protein